MTDAEILEKLRAYFQTKVENLSGDEMAEGPFEDGTEFGDAWEAAAKVIDRRGGLRIRFEFGDTEIEWGYRYRGEPDHFMRIVSSEETAREYVGGREGWEICKRVPAGPWERAVAEARPHDAEPCPAGECNQGMCGGTSDHNGPCGGCCGCLGGCLDFRPAVDRG